MKRHPTIIDVARKAGVSKTTVSRVVNGQEDSVREETYRRVQEAIEELGYTHNAVASSLRTDRTNTIMFSLPDIANPFWPAVARGVQDRMEEEGYAVVFANNDWDSQRENTFLEMAQRYRFDGILVNPVSVRNDQLKAAHIPAVLIGSHEDYPDFDIVGSDSYGATMIALEHLYSLGHRRIGLIRGERKSRPGHSRLRGYEVFLLNKGLPLDKELIACAPFEEAGGMHALHQLLSLANPPTAVLAANDILAIGAMQAAHAAGLFIPDQLSIVGMDDIMAARATNPGLTTIAKPKYEIGRQAADFLLDRLAARSQPEPRRHLFTCTLRQRGSTGPPDM
ncbi:MAG: LacI family DNA-binding transcriptional regulator [Candidatus Promineifilaceae bacterium]